MVAAPGSDRLPSRQRNAVCDAAPRTSLAWNELGTRDVEAAKRVYPMVVWCCIEEVPILPAERSTQPRHTTPGYINNKKRIQDRLNRLEGQVRGIHRMVDEERYCIDILTQVKAVKAALDRVAVRLLDDHVRHCVADAVRNGDSDEKVDELAATIGRFLAG
jgi:CsoR family transcriptional regulator, copper-sensing transcriptional repressor